MTTPVKLKLLPRSTIKAKTITRLVGKVEAGVGATVTEANGNFTVSFDNSGVNINGTTNEITVTNPGTATVALASKLSIQRSSTATVTSSTDFGDYFHRIYIPSDGKDVSGMPVGAQISTGLLIDQYPNNGAKGFRNALTAVCWVPPGSTVNTTGDYGYCGGLLFGKTDVTLGGTNTGAGAKGAVFGGNSFVSTGASATNLYGAVAHESDVLTLAGSTMKIRIGYSSVDFGSGAGTQGATVDAAFSAGATAGSVKWKNAFLISDINGGNPIAATGKLFATQDSATVAYGVDISSYTFSTAAFNSTGFSVDGSGNIAGKTTTLTSVSNGALTVGRQGAANPAFAVDASATTQAAGVLITGVAAGNTPGISVVSSGSNEGLVIDAKGSGTITLGNTSTGSILHNRATTVTSASANALAVGPNGTTNPTLKIQADQVSQATGWNIVGSAAGSGASIAVISSGTNELGAINAKGSGDLYLQNTATGAARVGAGGLFPITDDAAALGSTTVRWADLFLSTGAVINYNNGNVTLTHSSGLLTLAGDFAFSGSAWTAWSPTVTSSGGTITTVGTVVATYKQIGKSVFFRVRVPITTIGTASGRMIITLPVNDVGVAGSGSLTGFNGSNSKAVTGVVNFDAANKVSCSLYDGTFPAGSGETVYLAGFYEAA